MVTLHHENGSTITDVSEAQAQALTAFGWSIDGESKSNDAKADEAADEQPADEQASKDTARKSRNSK